MTEIALAIVYCAMTWGSASFHSRMSERKDKFGEVAEIMYGSFSLAIILVLLARAIFG